MHLLEILKVQCTRVQFSYLVVWLLGMKISLSFEVKYVDRGCWGEHWEVRENKLRCEWRNLHNMYFIMYTYELCRMLFSSSSSHQKSHFIPTCLRRWNGQSVPKRRHLIGIREICQIQLNIWYYMLLYNFINFVCNLARVLYSACKKTGLSDVCTAFCIGCMFMHIHHFLWTLVTSTKIPDSPPSTSLICTPTSPPKQFPVSLP
jgi:hypothetical protein